MESAQVSTRSKWNLLPGVWLPLIYLRIYIYIYFFFFKGSLSQRLYVKQPSLKQCEKKNQYHFQSPGRDLMTTSSFPLALLLMLAGLNLAGQAYFVCVCVCVCVCVRLVILRRSQRKNV